MSTRFSDAVEAAGGLGITREVSVGSAKYLCFTRFSDGEGEWLIGVSDGISVWRAGLTEDEVKEHSEDVAEASFLGEISQTLQSGEVQLLKSHDHMLLSLKCSSKQVDLTLYELSAANKRVEMQTLIFMLWDTLQTTRIKLQDLSEVQRAKTNFGEISVTSGGAGKTTTSRPRKAKGASLVNPNTKRRKVATGVVFDADD